MLLGGAGIDRLIVQIPGWYRIGPTAFADYARATDLGNGLVFYPILGVVAPLSTWAALVVGLVSGASTAIVTLLVIASVPCLLHSLTTTQAAPRLLALRRTNDPDAIAGLMNIFVRWSFPRAILQAFTAAVLVWTLVAGW